jgi:hypothetical protein
MRRTVIPGSLACVIAISAMAVGAAPSGWRPGMYQLQGDKFRSGTLTVQTASGGQATFTLEVVACRHSCGSDTAVNHIGSIGAGVIVFRGETGLFEATGPDESSSDPGRSACTLRFSSQPEAVLSVKQGGDCWWFGQGVDVSGRYRLIRTNEQQ